MITTHQIHIQESEGNQEFSFWGSSNTIASENDCDQPQGSEAKRLKNKANFGETHQRNNFKLEYSPFSSKISDPSRTKAIADGQRELMQMVQDIPESGYELSFQDMVVVEKHVVEPEQQQQQQKPHQNETSIDSTHKQSSGSKDQQKRLNRKKKNKGNSGRPGQILRVESMDSETFLLKMFFPISLDWMKKYKVKDDSNVNQKPPLQESMKQVGKEWRIKRFFFSGDYREDKISQNNGSRSHSDVNSLSLSHGCCPLLPYAKSKTENLGG